MAFEQRISLSAKEAFVRRYPKSPVPDDRVIVRLQKGFGEEGVASQMSTYEADGYEVLKDDDRDVFMWTTQERAESNRQRDISEANTRLVREKRTRIRANSQDNVLAPAPPMSARDFLDDMRELPGDDEDGE